MEKEYQVFSLQSPLREEWIWIMNTAYSQSHRHYHTLTHVQSMLKQLPTTDFSPKQLQILRLAVWFHDVVYDIPSESGYNESFSALKLQDYSRDARLVQITRIFLIKGYRSLSGSTVFNPVYLETCYYTNLPHRTGIY